MTGNRGKNQGKTGAGSVAVAALILGTAMGVAICLFTALRALVLVPIPLPHHDRLVDIEATVYRYGDASFPDAARLQPVLAHMAAYREGIGTWDSGADSKPIRYAAVTSDFFPASGIGLLAGSAGSATGGKTSVVVSATIAGRDGGPAAALGKQIEIDGMRFQIAGVAVRDFSFPAATQVWIPMLGPDPAAEGAYEIFGRLQPGVSLHKAEALLATVAHYRLDMLAQSQPGPGLLPFEATMAGARGPLLELLWAGSLLLVLLACISVAGLQLARADLHRPEMALRLALGASIWRLRRRLIMESATLAVASLGIGFGIAAGAWALLRPFWPAGTAPLPSGAINDVAAYSVLLVMLTCLACGLVPSLWAVGPRLANEMQNADGRLHRAGGRGGKRRSWLVGVQLASALVLLVGTLLLVRSFFKVVNAPLGFSPHHLLAATATLPESPDYLAAAAAYQNARQEGVKGRAVAAARAALTRAGQNQQQQERSYQNQSRQALEAIPGVAAVTVATSAPFLNAGANPSLFGVYPQANPNHMSLSLMRWVGTGFFPTLGVALLRGRGFEPSDTRAGAPKVAIVNQTLAHELWLGAKPIGHRLISWGTVIGVVADIRESGYTPNPLPTIYLPDKGSPTTTFIIRSRSAVVPAQLERPVARALLGVAPEAPANRVTTLDAALRTSTSGLRLGIALLGIYALLALLIGGLGLYALASEQNASRRQEFGIRMGLGARPEQIYRQVLAEGLRLGVYAAVAGACMAWALGHLLDHWLFHVSHLDWLSFGSAALLLFSVVVGALLLPAYRASRLDPWKALRG